MVKTLFGYSIVSARDKHSREHIKAQEVIEAEERDISSNFSKIQNLGPSGKMVMNQSWDTRVQALLGKINLLNSAY